LAQGAQPCKFVCTGRLMLTPPTGNTLATNLGPNDTPQLSLSTTLDGGEIFHTWEWWYPTWDAWKFRRTLAYWIAIMYLEGSVLFIAGAAFSMSSLVIGAAENKKALLEKALVTTPYFVGGLAFTTGCYANILEVVNLPDKHSSTNVDFFFTGRRQWQQLKTVMSWKTLHGVIWNFVGAIAFNVDTLLSYVNGLNLLEIELFLWGSATLGGLGFTIGGLLECNFNRVWELDRIKTAAWWISMCNTIGGVLFLVAGVSGELQLGANIDWWLIDFTYFVGSIYFFIGGIFSLWMWKCEQYGLGMIPEMNVAPRRQSLREDVLAMHSEYGCGKADALQIPWLLMYQVNATASVIQVGLAVFAPDVYNLNALLNALVNFALSHGILLLGSVIHHTPKARPFNWLLIYMRVCLLFFTLNSWIAVVADLKTV